MSRGDTKESKKSDWRVSAILLAVWLVALVALAGRESDIPRSMLAIATVFFVMLIPAMNDLVSSIDRRLGGRRTGTETDE